MRDSIHDTYPTMRHLFRIVRRTYIRCPSPRVPESASGNLELRMRMSERSPSSMTSTSYSQTRTRIPSSSSKSNARRTSTHRVGRSSVTNVSLNNRAEPARTVVNGGRRTRSLFCLAPATASCTSRAAPSSFDWWFEAYMTSMRRSGKVCPTRR